MTATRFRHGARTELSMGELSTLFQYRYDVFVDFLGWDLPLENEHRAKRHELDQFDTDDAVYVLAENHNGRPSGCARLLPTDKPYLLGEVFPELLDGEVHRKILRYGSYLDLQITTSHMMVTQRQVY